MAEEKKASEKTSTTRSRPASSSRGTRAAAWREDLASVAGRVLADDELQRLRERLDDVGAVGDMVVAAHLDDLLFVERARYQRARREVGRAMALGNKDDVARARDRLRVAGESLGVVRLQRDLATGQVVLPVGDDTIDVDKTSAD
jgi:hypothetical protein